MRGSLCLCNWGAGGNGSEFVSRAPNHVPRRCLLSRARLLPGATASTKMEAVIAHKEGLKLHVPMLSDVLKEASEEITSLKARANASEVEAEEARRALHDRLREDVDVLARLAALQAAAGKPTASAGAGMSVDVAGSTATPVGIFATPVGGTPGSGRAGCRVPIASPAGELVAQVVQALRDMHGACRGPLAPALAVWCGEGVGEGVRGTGRRAVVAGDWAVALLQHSPRAHACCCSLPLCVVRGYFLARQPPQTWRPSSRTTRN